MFRGNQRELARQKNQKKNSDKPKQREDGLSHEQRKQRDADIMRQKQQKKEGPGAGAQAVKS
ncbi:small EDRK-rich factor 2 isoform X2 [Anopheles bellator]|uniref:small EDRK-rich factor 2 isoform X2 n=1 Tax=Anopheles bellator TaxID=139047 RepID=UPI0026472CEA|nr:small EDRK-rich factor 2 isoform X2 [Anopheles bellator]